MDSGMLEKMLKMMTSRNDVDALMGLRSTTVMFAEMGVPLPDAILYAAKNIDLVRKGVAPVIEQAAVAAPAPAAQVPVTVSGMPQCRVAMPGKIEIILSGHTKGEIVALPGASASDAENVALHLKDALVAAVINKSRFKLKLFDVVNNRQEIVETILRAEYERPGMTPVPVWAHVRGEAAALATVLRRAIAATMPELVAA